MTRRRRRRIGATESCNLQRSITVELRKRCAVFRLPTPATAQPWQKSDFLRAYGLGA